MNRQVPETPKTDPVAIVGNGKVAHHLIQYFGLVGQPFVHWFRKPKSTRRKTQDHVSSKLAVFKQKLQSLIQPTAKATLAETIAQVNTVVLLIPDDQIERFIQQNPVLKDKTCIHFSGSLNSKMALGCHPLMTFGDDLYDLDTYQSIPFVIDENVDFYTLFPKFKNPTHAIKAEYKAIYHAYCVMAGNFSQMLWKTIGQEMQDIDLPADLMSLFLMQNTKNFITSPDTSATGPFVRGDYVTIEKHQQALQDHPLAPVYQAFYDLHQTSTIPEQRKQS